MRPEIVLRSFCASFDTDLKQTGTLNKKQYFQKFLWMSHDYTKHRHTQGGWFGGFKPARNSEVLKKLDQITSSVEYTSVTT
jgi:hypothetical protein